MVWKWDVHATDCVFPVGQLIAVPQSCGYGFQTPESFLGWSSSPDSSWDAKVSFDLNPLRARPAFEPSDFVFWQQFSLPGFSTATAIKTMDHLTSFNWFIRPLLS